MTGAEVQRNLRARALLEAGLATFLDEAEQSLIESQSNSVLVGEFNPQGAVAAWARVAMLRGLKKEAERRARLLAPMTVMTGGGL